ncbi:alpha/beta hydrolase [Humibacillus sp. DSM 29435]|uniref:alpha/beta hydrolase n=1 Tax=Humibacillus sp. DSM 29435 TaxID=1869167 RepID=UPI001586AF8C|nr:alpha/beta hydrolase [Humibacillus sp. DSM 29435]
MVLDDEVREFLAAAEGVTTGGDPAQQRQSILRLSDRLFARFGESGPEVASVTDHWVTHDGGRCRVRVYRPDVPGALPVHLFIHGGAYWLGSTDESVNDATCRERAVGAGCVVVSVDYSLAPEHPFPAALADCYAALVWSQTNADALGIDADRITVGGISAGGTLAAAVALAARVRNGPALLLQLLEVPLLDLSLETMRRSGVGDDFGINEADLGWSIKQYLPMTNMLEDPLASPLCAEDLAGLPPALVLTAERDPLRDDGRRYAERLEQAGVPVRLVQQPGAVHGSLQLTATWKPARAWRHEVVAALRTANGEHSPTMTTHHQLDPAPRFEHNQGGT